VAIAVHSFHDAKGYFPLALERMDPSPPANVRHWFWSWMTQILPYFEQQNLYTAADNWDAIPGNNTWPWVYGNPGLETPLKILQCQADGRQPRIYDFGGYKATFTGILGVRGTKYALDDGLICNTKVLMTQIGDGTSNTLMVGERPPSNDYVFGWWFNGAGFYMLNNSPYYMQGTTTYYQNGTGDVVLGTNDPQTAAALATPFNGGYTCPASKIQFGPGKFDDNCDSLHFWAPHTGGAHFAFGDGSVRFLSYSIGSNTALMSALATRAGGESVAIP